MGSSLIRQFEAYTRKVFHWPEFLAKLQDRRQRPRVSLPAVIGALLYGTVMRRRALAEIEQECRTDFLRQRVGPCSDDTLGYALDHLESASLRAGWHQLAKIVKRNGLLRQGGCGGLIVGVLDGIETLNSYYRHCDCCLERQVNVKEHKVEKTVTQYYHRCVVLCLIGYAFPIPLELERLRPGEGEVECALRLLARVRRELGSRFLDGVMADSLYCTPAFFTGCAALNIAAAAVLKANQPALLAEALGQKEQSPPPLQLATAAESIRLWDLPQVDWATAGMDLRVILAERSRTAWPRRQPGEKEKYAAQVFNAFAFAADWPALPTTTAFHIGRRRWDIDAALFQDLTQNWHLKHPTAHFAVAYENLLIIRLIAYLLAMCFTCSHVNPRRKTPLPASLLAVRLYQAAVADTSIRYPLLL